MALVASQDRRRGAKNYLRRLNRQQTVFQKNAQYEANLQKLQVASIVKKAVAEDEGIRSKLFDSIKRHYPDNPNAFDIFEQQLEHITSRDPEGTLLDSFSEQILEYMEMGDYAVGGHNDKDDLNEELAAITAEAKKIGASAEGQKLGPITRHTRSSKKSKQ